MNVSTQALNKMSINEKINLAQNTWMDSDIDKLLRYDNINILIALLSNKSIDMNQYESVLNKLSSSLFNNVKDGEKVKEKALKLLDNFKFIKNYDLESKHSISESKEILDKFFQYLKTLNKNSEIENTMFNLNKDSEIENKIYKAIEKLCENNNDYEVLKYAFDSKDKQVIKMLIKNTDNDQIFKDIIDLKDKDFNTIIATKNSDMYMRMYGDFSFENTLSYLYNVADKDIKLLLTKNINTNENTLNNIFLDIRRDSSINEDNEYKIKLLESFSKHPKTHQNALDSIINSINYSSYSSDFYSYYEAIAIHNNTLNRTLQTIFEKSNIALQNKYGNSNTIDINLNLLIINNKNCSKELSLEILNTLSKSKDLDYNDIVKILDNKNINLEILNNMLNNYPESKLISNMIDNLKFIDSINDERELYIMSNKNENYIIQNIALEKLENIINSSNNVDVLTRIEKFKDNRLNQLIVNKIDCPSAMLNILSNTFDDNLKINIANHPNTDEYTLSKLFNEINSLDNNDDIDEYTKDLYEALTSNNNTPINVLNNIFEKVQELNGDDEDNFYCEVNDNITNNISKNTNASNKLLDLVSEVIFDFETKLNIVNNPNSSVKLKESILRNIDLETLNTNDMELIASSKYATKEVLKNLVEYNNSKVNSLIIDNHNVSKDILTMIANNGTSDTKTKALDKLDSYSSDDDYLSKFDIKKSNIVEDDLDMSKLNDQMSNIGSNEVENTSTNKNNHKR